MNFEDSQFIIIIGQPKAGTTSLYNWLAAHPDISPSLFKEARFFLDADYPLQRPAQFKGNNLSNYESLFPQAGRKVYLEGTPDYLYNKTPLKISELLPNATVVAVIRDPIDRLVSAFRYFQQRGILPLSMAFHDYIMLQSGLEITPSTPVQYRALEHCRADKYLSLYRAAFGTRCIVFDFSRLKNDPHGLVADICRRSGIDTGFYADFAFPVANVTGSTKFPLLVRTYDYASTRIAYALGRGRSERLRKGLSPISRYVRMRITEKTPPRKIAVSTKTKNIITDYISETTP